MFKHIFIINSYQTSNMAVYMQAAFIIAIISLVLYIATTGSKKLRKYKYLSVFLSFYALVIFIIAIFTNDPIEGLSTEAVTIVTVFPFGLILTKLSNDIWNMTKEFPVMTNKLDSIEKKVEKITRIEDEIHTHRAICDERHRKKR